MIYSDFRNIIRDRTEISVRYDVETASVWCYLKPKVRPCFSYKMLYEIHTLQQELISYFQKYDMNPPVPVKFFVWASQANGIFNYGGDLEFVVNLIEKKDRNALSKYSMLATEIIYLNIIHLGLPLITISVVDGRVLAGGFEAAYSCNKMIVEEQVKIGLPEIKFNHFPGMGAYSLLARTIGVSKTEEILISGKTYPVKELLKMGLKIDLVPTGQSVDASIEYMIKTLKFYKGLSAIVDVRNIYMQISREELMRINKIWIDTAMQLDKKDIKTIRRFISTQNLKYNNSYIKRARQDRRINFNTEEFYNAVEKRVCANRRKVVM